MNIWDGCKKGEYDMVKFMLGDRPAWANTKDDRDVSPLSYAVVGESLCTAFAMCDSAERNPQEIIHIW
jgi:hypothetical protein